MRRILTVALGLVVSCAVVGYSDGGGTTDGTPWVVLSDFKKVSQGGGDEYSVRYRWISGKPKSGSASYDWVIKVPGVLSDKYWPEPVKLSPRGGTLSVKLEKASGQPFCFIGKKRGGDWSKISGDLSLGGPATSETPAGAGANNNGGGNSGGGHNGGGNGGHSGDGHSGDGQIASNGGAHGGHGDGHTPTNNGFPTNFPNNTSPTGHNSHDAGHTPTVPNPGFPQVGNNGHVPGNDGHVPPAGNPGNGGFPGFPGVVNDGHGGTTVPGGGIRPPAVVNIPDEPTVPPGTPQYTVQYLVIRLAKGRQDGLAPFIASNAQGPLGLLRQGQLGLAELGQLKAAVGAVQFAGASTLPNGSRLLVLRNAAGQLIQVSVRRENGNWVVDGMNVGAAPAATGFPTQ